MTARRTYDLGKRAAAVDETRRRILDAAAQAYRDLGIRATSMQEVARRADVAAGTVLHHFPDPDGLAEAVVARITESLDLPTRRDFADARSGQARIAGLIREIYRFYDRGEAWVEMHFRERTQVPALAAGEAKVMGAIGDLMHWALGPLAHVPEVRAVVSSALDPGFRGALLRNGLSGPQAAEVATELVTRWLGSRLSAEGSEEP